MNKPIKTRFPCKHGIWFRHMIKPVGIKPEWCDGGATKWLQRTVFEDMLREGQTIPGYIEVTEPVLT